MVKRRRQAGPDAEVELLAAIPADVTVTPLGEQLSAEEIEEARRTRAREWARAGFTDPTVVRAWIGAGVSAEVAMVASRRGCRPGDPWVPRGYTRDPEWNPQRPEPVAGPVAAWRTRRRLRRAWLRQQERLAAGQAMLEQAADQLRQSVTAGSGGLGLLTAFDVAAATAAGPDPELIAGALDALGVQARAVRELAAATADHRSTHTAGETAHWLQGQFATAVFPSADTIPLAAGGDPDRWLAREALSLADYAGYLQAFTEPIRAHLDHLDDAEKQHGGRELDLAGAELDTARRAWQDLAKA